MRNPSNPVFTPTNSNPSEEDPRDVQRIESSKVWPKEDGTPTPAYRLLDMYFTDYDAASEAVTTDEAATYFPLVFELATGGVRIVFADVEVAQDTIDAVMSAAISPTN